MRKYLLHVLIISFVFLSTTIHAAEEEKDRLLVVPLKAQIGIKKVEAILLTDILSIEIYRSGKFTILNRDDMKAVFDEKEFEQDAKSIYDDCIKKIDDEHSINILQSISNEEEVHIEQAKKLFKIIEEDLPKEASSK